MVISKTTATIGSIVGGLGIVVTGGTIYVTSTGTTESTTDNPTQPEDNVVEGSTIEVRKLSLPKTLSIGKTLKEVKDEISNWSKDNGECKIKIRLTKGGEFKEIERFNADTEKDGLENLYKVLSGSEGEDAKKKCKEAGKNRKMEIRREDSGSKWIFKIETLESIKAKIEQWAKKNGNCKIKVKLGKESSKEIKDFTEEDKKTHLIGLHVYLTDAKSTSAKNECTKDVILEATKSNNWTLTKVSE